LALAARRNEFLGSLAAASGLYHVHILDLDRTTIITTRRTSFAKVFWAGSWPKATRSPLLLSFVSTLVP
jgi:hypothetical protein